MLLSAVSFLVVSQSSSEIPEGLMNNPVYSLVFIAKYLDIIQYVVTYQAPSWLRLLVPISLMQTLHGSVGFVVD